MYDDLPFKELMRFRKANKDMGIIDSMKFHKADDIDSLTRRSNTLKRLLSETPKTSPEWQEIQRNIDSVEERIKHIREFEAGAAERAKGIELTKQNIAAILNGGRVTDRLSGESDKTQMDANPIGDTQPSHPYIPGNTKQSKVRLYDENDPIFQKYKDFARAAQGTEIRLSDVISAAIGEWGHYLESMESSGEKEEDPEEYEATVRRLNEAQRDYDAAIARESKSG